MGAFIETEEEADEEGPLTNPTDTPMIVHTIIITRVCPTGTHLKVIMMIQRSPSEKGEATSIVIIVPDNRVQSLIKNIN